MIETQIRALLDEYQSVLDSGYAIPFSDEWRRLSRILEERIDRDFAQLIQAALDAELHEVEEQQQITAARLRLTRRLAILVAVLAILFAGVASWWLLRDLKATVERLIQGAQALASGDRRHRIPTAGPSELDAVACAFNHMADQVASRERLLQAANLRLEQAVAERTALLLPAAGGFDVLVLDLMLPGISGQEVCRRLRARRDQTPVLKLTALGAVDDRVSGLRMGADDYLVKPFDFDELVARIEALARRAAIRAETGTASSLIQVGPLSLHLESLDVRCGDQPIELTLKEREILRLFLTNPDKVFSRERILSRVWGLNEDPQTNVVDVYIGRLRKKLGGCAEAIETLRSVALWVRLSRACLDLSATREEPFGQHLGARGSAADTARHDAPLGPFEEPLGRQREQRGGNRAFHDERGVIQADAGQDRLPEASGTDQGAQRRRTDVDHRGRLDPRQDGRQRERELDPPEPGPSRQPERDGGLAQGLRDARDSGMRVPQDGQQAVEKERDERRTRANAEQRNHDHQQRQRRYRLEQPGACPGSARSPSGTATRMAAASEIPTRVRCSRLCWSRRSGTP